MWQTFEYPNLVAGTDEWTDWWTPEVGTGSGGGVAVDER